jgi:hypothetical protein
VATADRQAVRDERCEIWGWVAMTRLSSARICPSRVGWVTSFNEVRRRGRQRGRQREAEASSGMGAGPMRRGHSHQRHRLGMCALSRDFGACDRWVWDKSCGQCNTGQ